MMTFVDDSVSHTPDYEGIFDGARAQDCCRKLMVDQALLCSLSEVQTAVQCCVSGQVTLVFEPSQTGSTWSHVRPTEGCTRMAQPQRQQKPSTAGLAGRLLLESLAGSAPPTTKKVRAQSHNVHRQLLVLRFFCGSPAKKSTSLPVHL